MSGSVAISSFPLIIAGPILRRVDPATESAPGSVTAWVALKASSTVSLTVSADGTTVLHGSGPTRKVGEHLHVIAVTADSSPGDESLVPGTVYRYDLTFQDGAGSTTTLEAALGGDLSAVTYPSQPLPTFSVPPSNPGDLRIVHGSCRKPHGEREDALPAVDAMLRSTVDEATDRPHQLFLTGDQIYADDVADVLLEYIDELGPTLLDRTETFGSGPDARTISDMSPGNRAEIATDACGFTSGAARSHLFGLAEFYAMYLLAWSDAVWPDQLATPDEVLTEEHETAMRYVTELGDEPFDEDTGWVEQSDVLANISWQLHDAGRYHDQGEFIDAVDALEAFTEAKLRVESFQADVPAVRRALANVPTYMIFDDHEITDDWYLNAAWCKRVVQKEMGRQVLQNGLLAYAIFQGWGNDPAQFEAGTTGERILEAATLTGSSPGADLAISRGTLDDQLGIPSVSAGELVWPDDPINWHFGVTGTSDGTTPAHEVLVLDTRTKRGFEATDDAAPPKLIRADAIESQLPATSGLPEVTVVVTPAPVWTVPLADTAQDLYYLAKDAAVVDYEHWRLQHDARERLLARLATRGPAPDPGTTRSRVVFLAGDVHHGFTARAQYWATRPFGAPSDTQSEIVMASLTASAAKNTEIKTDLLQILGFAGGWILASGLGVIMLAGELVWVLFDENPPPSYRTAEGLLLAGYPLAKLLEGAPEEVNFGWNDDPPTGRTPPDIVETDPFLVRIEDDLDDVYELDPAPAPDWRYRVDFLDAETYHEDGVSHTVADPTDIIVPPHGATGAETRAKAHAAYIDHLAGWAGAAFNEDAGPSDRGGEWGFGSEIVGWNNIGEVAFEWGAEKRVVHALWWRLWDGDGALPAFPLSKYVVSLEYDVEAHPRPEVVARS